MTKKQTTPPAEHPVTLEEIRQQLGITQADDISRDAIITTRIKSATRWCEHHINKAIVTQNWTLYADCFEPVFALQSDLHDVVAVRYKDPNGILSTLDVSNYQIDTVGSAIYLAHNSIWPDVRPGVNSVQIEHTSGFGDATQVPEEIKEAIKFIVGHWENYQSTIEGAERITTIPYAVTQLLAHHVDMRNIF